GRGRQQKVFGVGPDAAAGQVLRNRDVAANARRFDGPDSGKVAAPMCDGGRGMCTHASATATTPGISWRTVASSRIFLYVSRTWRLSTFPVAPIGISASGTTTSACRK